MDLKKELARIHKMGVTELRQEYQRQFGDETLVGNKAWLQKRISWRIQERAEGGLSERAKRRAEELADDAFLRMSPPKERKAAPPSVPLPPRDPRLPMVGSAITRTYKGRTIGVVVCDDGFEYRGETYSSLSAVCKAITGSHMNGFHFFGLTAKKEVARG
jgi:hypothetical protein